MFESGKNSPGAMAAILGMNGEKVAEICAEIFPEKEIVVANLNSPIQTVISGQKDKMDEALTTLKERGARRAIALPVSGAFHSPLLAEGEKEFADYLQSVEINTPQIAWISNRTGVPESEPDTIRMHLSAQLTSPVQWVKTMEALNGFECESFLEVGPGKVLTGLAKGCGATIPCIPISSPQEIESL